CFILIFLIGGIRLVFRIIPRKLRAFRSDAHEPKRPRTLIIGAGETGSLTIERMASKDPLMPGIPIVATDDDPAKRGQRIHGVKVEGTSDDILRLVDEHKIEQIVVAIPSASLEERKRIFGICAKTDCRLRTLPNVRELTLDEIGDVKLRDVDVADLLGREEIILNTRSISGYIKDETILVTGGGGSIGSELCRQLCRVSPKRVIVFDIYENDAFMLEHELQGDFPEVEIIIEIGNVCDEVRVSEIFEKYKPGVVFHAAAHKHVPLMERCPREAVQNNIFGTLNTVRAADAHGVRRFIFVSTDKAVNPTSVMGATKRMGEMIIQYYAKTSNTVFTAVRFGNVLASSGSVIPIFQRQIAAGGPLTVTHPDIERYFMTISEAARLVVQAGGIARGGEIFILDMGEPVKIVDLARSLIQLSGYSLEGKIEIEFTGLRKGEKLFEELLGKDESTLPTEHSSILVLTGQEISYDEFAEKLEDLKRAIAASDKEAIAALEQAVPSYTYTNN
ncbi:MAG: polysaccharide biosynthesis protein, partial [Eggerthellaceae bacterium]|nr:polysaccharide biosynthesis protein [Eggerthellaceae bacterium]